MDSLIALGAGISILYSIYNLIIASVNGNDVMTASEAGIHYYFESAGMILTFISVGKYLESKSKSKTSSAISKLVKLTPKTALVEKDGVETEIETSEVVKNDIVICKNGNNIPVDGEIVFGNSDFMMSCACSAGPAFEGGDISCGMRATDGAVDSVAIDPDTLEQLDGLWDEMQDLIEGKA